MFISISGEAGAGKDTLAAILEEYYAAKGLSVAPFSFAGPLKDACVLWFGWDRQRLDHDFDYKEGGLGNKDPNDIDPYCVSFGMTRRQFMQKFGTEGMRDAVHKNFWIVMMTEWIRSGRIQTTDVSLIRDARFLNELQFVKDMGGLNFRVRRIEVPKGMTEHEAITAHLTGLAKAGTLTADTTHASETEWKQWTQWDHQVLNLVFEDMPVEYGKQRFREQALTVLRGIGHPMRKAA